MFYLICETNLNQLRPQWTSEHLYVLLVTLLLGIYQMPRQNYKPSYVQVPFPQLHYYTVMEGSDRAICMFVLTRLSMISGPW